MISAITFLFLIVPGLVFGFSGTYFQLDGDPYVQGCGDDWSSLYFNSGVARSFSGIMPEGMPQMMFKGQTTKNYYPISQWQWKTGSPADVKNILHGFSAYYSASQPDHKSYLYFGTDRASSVRNTFVSFWFLQESVGTNTNGTFYGNHRDGDLLVLTAFDATPIIDLYMWKNNNITNIYSTANGMCQVGASQKVCVIPNSQPVQSPWPYPPTNEFPANSFLEGGIDLEAVYENETVKPCFETVVVASTTNKVDQVLKDLMITPISTCSLRLDIFCGEVNLAPNNVDLIYDFSVDLVNDGFGQLYNSKMFYQNSSVSSSALLLANEKISYASTISTPEATATVESVEGAGYSLPNTDNQIYLIDTSNSRVCYAPDLTTSLTSTLNCYDTILDWQNNIIRMFYNGTIENTGFGGLTLQDHQIGPFGIFETKNDFTGVFVAPGPQNAHEYAGNVTMDNGFSFPVFLMHQVFAIDYKGNQISDFNWRIGYQMANCPMPDFVADASITGECMTQPLGGGYLINDTVTVCNQGTIKMINVNVLIFRFGAPHFEQSIPELLPAECRYFDPPIYHVPIPNIQPSQMLVVSNTQFDLAYINKQINVQCVPQ